MKKLALYIHHEKKSSMISRADKDEHVRTTKRSWAVNGSTKQNRIVVVEKGVRDGAEGGITARTA